MVRCPAYSTLRVQFGIEGTLQQCITRSDQMQLGRFLTAALGICEQILQPRLQAGEGTQRTITEFFQREVSSERSSTRASGLTLQQAETQRARRRPRVPGYQRLRPHQGEISRLRALYHHHLEMRMDGNKEEGSSSEDRQSNPIVHEVGEGSSQAEEGFPHVAFSITGTASPGTLFGGMQSMVPNPMYANIGLHPGFQGTQGQFGVSQGNLGMAGFSIPPVNMTPRHQQYWPGSTDGSHSFNHPTSYQNHQQQKQQCEASKGSSAISRWTYLMAHISDPSRQVLGRECRDAGQVPPREPCPKFKSFLSDGGKVEDLLILSLCKRILQRSKRRSKRQQLPRPPPSQLEVLIPAGSCVTTDKHKIPYVAVIQAEKVASSPPLQNEVFVSEQIPNAVMDIPPNSTLSQSTTSLQEDFTVSDKPMEYLTVFQPMVITQQKTQVSLQIVSLEADKDSIFSWTKVKATNDFDKRTNQVADVILIFTTKMRQVRDEVNIQFGIYKIVRVNNNAMTWDLTVRALDVEALQKYISLLPEFLQLPWALFKEGRNVTIVTMFTVLHLLLVADTRSAMPRRTPTLGWSQPFAQKSYLFTNSHTPSTTSHVPSTNGYGLFIEWMCPFA
ncbi:hypothetical protein L7F22_058247 [Adiantum nelumboides]|nr:hypothetical protein [Adiantum nelumboides]